jgi:hypothetical protein
MERLAEQNKGPMTLRQRFAEKRLNLDLETWLPRLAERLQRQAAALARLAASGAVLADRIVASVRKRDRRHQTETSYWRQEVEDVQAQTKARSRNRGHSQTR